MYAAVLALPSTARFLALSASSCASLSVRAFAASFLSLRSSALLPALPPVPRDPKLTVDVVDGGGGGAQSNESELRVGSAAAPAAPALLLPLLLLRPPPPPPPSLRSFVMPERMLPVTEWSECTEMTGERGAGPCAGEGEGDRRPGDVGNGVWDLHFLTPGQAQRSFSFSPSASSSAWCEGDGDGDGVNAAQEGEEKEGSLGDGLSTDNLGKSMDFGEYSEGGANSGVRGVYGEPSSGSLIGSWSRSR